MASNVFVLLNGGKRQAVKTTPMMPLKQIIKLVCEKQGYTDIENYGLKQNKTVLDLSLSVRFANLAPGAKLELIRVTTPKGHSEVTIALQMDDGGRIIEKFPTTVTLWEILLHFENIQDKSLNLTKRTAPVPQTKKGLMKKFSGKLNNKLFYQQPVCLLLNQEYGTISLLKSTTLQSAGINSGNVLLRILFRHTELSLDDVLEEINTPIQSSTETNPINENNSGISVQSTTPQISSTSEVELIVETNMQVNSVESIEKMNMQVKPTEEINTQVDLVLPVEEAKMQEIQVNSVETEESLAPVESKSEIFLSQSDEMDIDTKSPDVQDSTVKSLKDQEHTEKIIVSEVEQPSVTQTSSDTNTNGSVKEHFNREVKVFNPPSENVALLTQIELPDSFYELTPLELQFLLAMQSSKRTAEENAGFKTHAVREQEEKARERKYPKTLIRVRFPDSFQLQITFLSKETVGQLYEFVKDALRAPQCSFLLYTSPPKKVLSDMSVSLYQAELAPASVVYFSWTDKFPESGHFLSDEFLKLRIDIPHQVADKSTSTIVSEQSSSFNNEGAHVLSEPSRHRNLEELAQEQRSHARGGSSSSQISSKVPKWLKIGGKK